MTLRPKGEKTWDTLIEGPATITNRRIGKKKTYPLSYHPFCRIARTRHPEETISTVDASIIAPPARLGHASHRNALRPYRHRYRAFGRSDVRRSGPPRRRYCGYNLRPTPAAPIGPPDPSSKLTYPRNRPSSRSQIGTMTIPPASAANMEHVRNTPLALLLHYCAAATFAELLKVATSIGKTRQTDRKSVV